MLTRKRSIRLKFYDTDDTSQEGRNAKNIKCVDLKKDNNIQIAWGVQ